MLKQSRAQIKIVRIIKRPMQARGGKMKKVYVAGKLNDDAVHYIMNMHRMIRIAKKIREAGYAVYVPCNDFLEGLVDGKFDYKEYFDNSQPWLLSADAVFLVPGWESSTGTRREMALADSHGIPIFDSIEKMNEFFATKQPSKIWREKA